ncbi:RNase adapter RapZ [Candidatus Symbiobacter mobilis]|uniref:Kinase-like protein n=1 Tax=Candidatus Symbiobacter mobilis CR TaxID=946483 RepID=U5NAS8_9BURK|nr:RNase adapter RapZ [Candidatus Symbiobacter mobilis]AGX87304.1 kinase-like protein [Candidatus Symbiobacter mobilis CR]
MTKQTPGDARSTDDVLELVLITGMSGSGKSVALNALEDVGYYCVDNLPPGLMTALVEWQRAGAGRLLAIAIDARSAAALPEVPAQLDRLRTQGVRVSCLFLDASTPTLVRRFSETRRRHPLSETSHVGLDGHPQRALNEALELERGLLAALRDQAHVVDTSVLRPTQLQSYVKALFPVQSPRMTLVFESFAFKRGLPNDADFVFDVRMLPNPHYEPDLRELTGRDEPVAAFLRQQPDVGKMLGQVRGFLEDWLGAMEGNHRSYVTVAIGCTGGQHRSVYLVEQLALHFAPHWATLRRHRELDAQPTGG